MQLDQLGEPSSFEAIAARYAGRPWLAWFAETEAQNDPETNGLVAVRLVRGDLRVDDDLVTGDGPWAMVVDGDLETTGDLICRTGDYRVSTLIVTGDVRARNVGYHTSARVGIYGGLTVTHLILGTWGDSGAVLGAQTIAARLVIVDPHTSIGATDRNIRAIVVGSPGWQEFVPDLTPDPDTDPASFGPAVLDRGMLDPHRAWGHRDHPGAIVLPDVERALRMAKGLPLDHGETSTT